jgi:hypothetical protein
LADLLTPLLAANPFSTSRPAIFLPTKFDLVINLTTAKAARRS